MIPFVKILHINSEVETDITKYLESAIISKVAEAKKNSITLTLKNPNGKLSNINFEKDNSTIKAYLDWEPLNGQDPQMVATLTTISYPVDDSGFSKIKIKAIDKTGLFLSKLWAFSYSADEGLTAPEIIKNVINHSQDNLPDSEKITFNNVATAKSNGATFPTGVSISKTWKPIYEWINELSSTDSTGDDREYVYFLDEDNDLHWSYPYQKQSTTLTSNISDSDATIPVVNADTYPDSGGILIGDEQVTYTGISRGVNP